ncbi:O-antigen ligase family protein [Candidatus Parcubacteria bacterium]|nr:MAG: O-antigen ligase family protein [Candidatus Parcubacteria bacterium]
MFNLFLYFALLVFAIISYRRPIFGLATIVVLLPSYLWRINILSLPATFLELMILLLFVVWLLKQKKYKKINLFLSSKAENKIEKPLRYILLFWLLASVLALVVNFSYASLGLWRAYFLEPLMFFLLFVYLPQDKKDWQLILKSLVILLSWLFVVAIYQNFSSWNFIAAYNYPNPKRLTAVFSYPNALSLLTAPIAIFFFGLWAEAKEKKKYLWYLLVAILGGLLSYLAHSEGALVAIVISLFIYLILAKKTRKLAFPFFVVLFILSLFVFPVSDYGDKLWQELSTPGKNLDISSLEIRSWQWRETSAMLSDKFIFGSGINGYQQDLKSYHHIDWVEIYLYPHNIFLNFWVELGLFGLLVFLALGFYIVLQLKKLFKQGNILAWPLSLAWLTWFVHGLVDVPYFKNDLSLLFFIFLALTFSTYKNIEQGVEDKR